MYITFLLYLYNYISHHFLLSFCQPSSTPTDTGDDQSQEPSGSEGSGGTVAGIVCALLVVLLVVGISVTVIAILTRRRMQSPKQEGMNNPVYGTFKCLSIHYNYSCVFA